MSTEVEKVDSSVPDIKEQIVKKDLLNESSVKNEKVETPELTKKENEIKDDKACNDHTVEINDKKDEQLGTKENKISNDKASNKEIKDEGSKDQKEKDVSDKDTNKKETSNKEENVKKANVKETIDKEASDKEASDKEGSDKEASEKEASDKEASNKEASDKEDSDSEDNTGQTKESDEATSNLDTPESTPTCRARKKVQRLEVGFSTTKENFKIPEGSGQKLGDCPMIESQVTKNKAMDLKLLHKLLYNRPGNAQEVKRNIRKFSGFCFEKDSSNFRQKKNILDKLKKMQLRKLCEILGLELNGDKEVVVLRVLNFLMEPKDSGITPVKKGSSRNKKKAKKGSKKTTKKNAKAEESSNEEDNNKDTQSASEEDKSNHEESDHEESDHEESDHEVSDLEKKKLNSSKGKKTPAKAKPVKKEKAKKEPAKGTKRKKESVEVQADSSDDEEEPAAKKSKTPSDKDITKLVQQILEKADLQEITMKKVIKKVYDTYPDCDLTSKKPFIKNTIKSVIVTL